MQINQLDRAQRAIIRCDAVRSGRYLSPMLQRGSSSMMPADQWLARMEWHREWLAYGEHIHWGQYRGDAQAWVAKRDP